MDEQNPQQQQKQQQAHQKQQIKQEKQNQQPKQEVDNQKQTNPSEERLNQPNNNSNSQAQLNSDNLQSNVESNQPVSSNNHASNNDDEWESFESHQSNSYQNQIQALIQQAVQQLQESSSNQQPQNQSESQQEQQSQEPESKLGCQHYFRNCQVQAPCCQIYYSCKLCHDDKYMGPKSNGCKIERMSFSDVKNIKCLKCNKIQQPSLKCTNSQCQITFGKYACLKCKLYENNPAKVNDIFHCDECGMCRRGKVQNFFHCQICGYCRHISQKNKHKCAENVADSKCPICLQVLKFSLKGYIALPCGHLIHVKCQAQYRGLNCPVCGMATQKLSQSTNKQIQQQIELTKANLPKELIDKKVDVLCNECLHKSYQVPFHFFGIKCQGCGTYNTKLI